MQLLRLPSGETRITIVDWERAELALDTYGDDDLLTVTAWCGNEGASVDLTRHQVRQLLPHLEAFAARGTLEVTR